jgi:hypothetical protein
MATKQDSFRVKKYFPFRYIIRNLAISTGIPGFKLSRAEASLIFSNPFPINIFWTCLTAWNGDEEFSRNEIRLEE